MSVLGGHAGFSVADGRDISFASGASVFPGHFYRSVAAVSGAGAGHAFSGQKLGLAAGMVGLSGRGAGRQR